MFGVVGLAGIGILIYGLWGVIIPERARVEIIKSDTVTQCQGEQCGQIVIDVAGAVERPGVYKLPGGSRIGDVLVVAGGLSATADREWVAATLNLAEPVKDGGKIYIPTNTERETPSQNISEGVTLGSKTAKLININTADMGELDSLVGIGEVRARAIIANRPYGSTEELVSKAKIPTSVYDKIKDSISIY
ncbi:MAG: helix-hairpin-helix domain-containing protein [bacterium]